jgi:hypothetical protein
MLVIRGIHASPPQIEHVLMLILEVGTHVEVAWNGSSTLINGPFA